MASYGTAVNGIVIPGIFRVSSLFPSNNIPSGYKKIASRTGIDATAVATVALLFENGCSLENSLPVHTVISRITGTINGQIGRLTDGTNQLTALTTLTGIGATTSRIVANTTTGGTVAATGTLSFQTTVGSSVAATIKVEVYGIDLR